MDFRQAEAGQRFVVALHCQFGIGIGAREMNGPSCHHALGGRGPAVSGIGFQPLEEDLHEVLILEAAGMHDRALEQGRGGKGLDRLQEAAFAGMIDELADGRLSRLDLQRAHTELRILHEGERSTHAVRRAGAGCKCDGMGVVGTVRHREHRVCRAEIKPQRLSHSRRSS